MRDLAAATLAEIENVDNVQVLYGVLISSYQGGIPASGVQMMALFKHKRKTRIQGM